MLPVTAGCETRRNLSRWTARDWRRSCAASSSRSTRRTAALVRAVFESYAYVADLADDKDTSIRRLRQLFFGVRTETTAAVVGPKAGTPEADPPRDALAETGPGAGDGDGDESDATAGSKGHGRNGAEAYRGAARIDVPHPSLTAGDECPACGQGTVYEKAPGVLVRITGQPPLAATIYRLKNCAAICAARSSPRLHPKRQARRSTTPRPAAWSGS